MLSDDDLDNLAKRLPDMGGMSPVENALLAESGALNGSEIGKEVTELMERMGVDPTNWNDEDIQRLIELAPVTGTYYKMQKLLVTKPGNMEEVTALSVQIVDLAKRYSGGDNDFLTLFYQMV